MWVNIIWVVQGLTLKEDNYQINCLYLFTDKNQLSIPRSCPFTENGGKSFRLKFTYTRYFYDFKLASHARTRPGRLAWPVELKKIKVGRHGPSYSKIFADWLRLPDFPPIQTELKTHFLYKLSWVIGNCIHVTDDVQLQPRRIELETQMMHAQSGRQHQILHDQHLKHK